MGAFALAEDAFKILVKVSTALLGNVTPAFEHDDDQTSNILHTKQSLEAIVDDKPFGSEIHSKNRSKWCSLLQVRPAGSLATSKGSRCIHKVSRWDGKQRETF